MGCSDTPPGQIVRGPYIDRNVTPAEVEARLLARNQQYTDSVQAMQVPKFTVVLPGNFEMIQLVVSVWHGEFAFRLIAHMQDTYQFRPRCVLRKHGVVVPGGAPLNITQNDTYEIVPTF